MNKPLAHHRRFYCRFTNTVLGLLACCALGQWPVSAAPVWQIISSESNKRIELDSTSVRRNGMKVEAVGRVVLVKPLLDMKTGENYRVIEAQTRYDCAKRSASTLRRSYKRDETTLLRTENIPPVELPVRSGTLDDKMLREVCRPPRAETLTPVAPSNPEPVRTLGAPAPINRNINLAPPPPPPPAIQANTAPNAQPAANSKPDDTREAAQAANKTTAQGEQKSKQATETSTNDKAANKKPSFLPPLPPVDKSKKNNAQNPAGNAPQGINAQDKATTSARTSSENAAKTETSSKPLTAKERAKERRARQMQAIQEAQDAAAQLKAANDRLLAQEQERRVARQAAAAARAEKNKTRRQTSASASSGKSNKKMPHEETVAEPIPLEAGTARTVAGRSAADWRYEGGLGPGHWADLKPEYRLCRHGLRQSPIDVRDSIKVDLEQPKTNYLAAAHFDVRDIGYTLQVTPEPGSTLVLDGQVWLLQRIEFRAPGEEMIRGQRAAMSVHLIHRGNDGNELIVAVPLQTGPENPFIQQIWNNLPLARYGQVEANEPLNLQSIFPAEHHYITYLGSHTTPPCRENVQWLIFTHAASVSEEQINIFNQLYHNNARPVQPENGRLVKESRG